MKKYIFTFSMLLLACLMPASAQRKKAVKKKQPKPKVEIPVENPRFTEMLSSTQKLIIIDSMVVSKDKLLSAFFTNSEEGSVTTYDEFFNTQGHRNGMVYVNELGDKCIYSLATDSNNFHALYSRDLLGKEWSKPVALQGLEDDGLLDLNYPFMMPDGQTLYFAARGGDALGGYDIYRTRLDAESGRFLNPENIGLPFNSEDDDFLYVVSEQDSIGFFASTRRQPDGKVCVYTFIPSEIRQIYDSDALDEGTLRSFAQIERIRDTWGNNKLRNAALRRLKRLKESSLMAKQEAKKGKKEAFSFVINDRLVYHYLMDFRVAENRNRMSELLDLQRQLQVLDTSLDKARKRYATSSASEREKMRNDILHNERQHLRLLQQISDLEKEIRNRELNN
jgi:hypothetical protein